ncbi:GNAT family N-acetyltransferase [Bacillus sp. SCS-153A]|uniref:GNAT family N-acetyltransferase n=1 Tax=Rossellomorea sedimentorum TaxID=3115294 RepID=UPI003905F143
MIKVMAIGSQDIDEILTLFYETVHSVNARDYTDAQLNAWVSKKDLPEIREKWNRSFEKNFSYKAVIDNKIVGFGDIDPSGLLDRLYVHKEYQGKGTASALLDKIEEAARNNNVNEIVTFARTTARPFFEKKGYHVLFSQTVSRRGVEMTNYKMIKKGVTNV